MASIVIFVTFMSTGLVYGEMYSPVKSIRLWRKKESINLRLHQPGHAFTLMRKGGMSETLNLSRTELEIKEPSITSTRPILSS